MVFPDDEVFSDICKRKTAVRGCQSCPDDCASNELDPLDYPAFGNPNAHDPM